MKIGQLVTRKSYNNDLRFIIIDIINKEVILSGIDKRLIADAPIEDLISLKCTRNNDSYKLKNSYKNMFQYMLASLFAKGYYRNKVESTILHIDGDSLYLGLCMEEYRRLGVKAIGVSISEKDQHKEVVGLLKRVNPSILIITGHDSLKKDKYNSMNINDYKNSKYYVESVKKARSYNKDYNDLVIFAGGCKSFYEAIMDAGANFASSPKRILIDIMYPVYLAFKIAITSKCNTLSIDKISNEFLFEDGSIGGILTKGQLK